MKNIKLKIIILNRCKRSIHTLISSYLEEFFKKNIFKFSSFSPHTIQTYLFFSIAEKVEKTRYVDVKEERAKFLFGPASMHMRSEKETITYLRVKSLHVFERTGHRHQVDSQ